MAQLTLERSGMSGLSLETAGKTLKCILPSLEAAFVPVDKASNGFTRVGLVLLGKDKVTSLSFLRA